MLKITGPLVILKQPNFTGTNYLKVLRREEKRENLVQSSCTDSEFPLDLHTQLPGT